MSSSSSSGGDADWKPVPPCGCGFQHYHVDRIKWHAQDKSHHAVLVRFFCGVCRQGNLRTYDFSSDGKISRWGYYGRYLEIIMANSRTDGSYEKVEDIFRGMWTKYNVRGANCKDWARDFYDRVRALSPYSIWEDNGCA